MYFDMGAFYKVNINYKSKWNYEEYSSFCNKQWKLIQRESMIGPVDFNYSWAYNQQILIINC